MLKVSCHIDTSRGVPIGYLKNMPWPKMIIFTSCHKKKYKRNSTKSDLVVKNIKWFGNLLRVVCLNVRALVPHFLVHVHTHAIIYASLTTAQHEKINGMKNLNGKEKGGHNKVYKNTSTTVGRLTHPEHLKTNKMDG